MSELADKFEFRVRWVPFLLRPNTPIEGTPKPDGFADPNNPRVKNLKQAGREVGIDFAHKAAVTPNTTQAHALLDFVANRGDFERQDIISEKLFEAYFTKGDNLGETTLLSIAKDIGLDEGEVKAQITNPKVIEEIKIKAMSWGSKGVTGVPFFYMNGHRTFSGAQDIETFKHMINMAAEKYPQEPSSKS